ncbi:MAG: DUF177 domain-containing protein [Magnetococcales bacterium]|nr:DUF177 domain-containing protein [Magnetococcales bacterium]
MIGHRGGEWGSPEKGMAGAGRPTGGADLGEVTIILEKIGRKPYLMQGHLSARALSELGGLVPVPGPVWVDLLATRDGSSLHVAGRLGGRVELVCDRCLQPFARELEVATDREFVAGPEPLHRGGEWEVQDEVVYLEDGTFSLRRMVEEELILALPMRRLCREACAGLCMQCGADHNLGACGCSPPDRDTPFAVLKNLGSIDP